MTEVYRTVDGRGLRSRELSPDTNGWVDPTNNLMSSANYIGAIHLRGNLMPTAARTARYCEEGNRSCDSCRRTETLGHILKFYCRTFSVRINRHNAILARLVKKLITSGWCALEEPAIPTPAGVRRPDIPFSHRLSTLTSKIVWR